MMITLWQDLRYGFRMLGKSRGVTLAALVTLALGIGANSAIFSIVYSVLIRPLPYPDSERLVLIWNQFPGVGLKDISFSSLEFLDYKAQARSFEMLAAYARNTQTITGKAEPEQVWASSVSAELFPMLGVAPAVGRTFAPPEFEPGAPSAVVLSHGLWQRRFGGTPEVVGQTILLQGRLLTVIGVMPPTFRFPSTLNDVWIPLRFEGEQMNESQRGSRSLFVLGRLQQGVTLEMAQSELTSVARRLTQDHPQQYTAQHQYTATLISLHEFLVGKTRPVLLVLLATVAIVLLIACANVANLLLARAAARQKEIAVRVALGAGRMQLARQLLTENLILSLFGGVAGLLLALWAVDLLKTLAPVGALPRLAEIQVDTTALLFTFGVTLLTGLICALMPLRHSFRVSVGEALKEGGRGSGAGREQTLARRMLVVAETALSLVLLVSAGLLIRSFTRLVSVDPGFRPENVLSFRIALSAQRYSERAQLVKFFSDLVTRLQGMPGVEAAGAVTSLPFSGWRNDWGISVEGRADMQGREGDALPAANYFAVSPDYFKTLGIPLLRGRTFEPGDVSGTPVVLINQTMARKIWSDEDPIGKRIRQGGEGAPYPWRTIVGIVGDVRQSDLETDVISEIFVPYEDQRKPMMGAMFVVARTANNPIVLAPVVRREVAAMDPLQAVSNLQTMEERLALSVAERRFSLVMVGIFASLALVLAAVGVYSVVAYSVAQRTREIGVRMALGAQRGDIFTQILRQGAMMAAAGIAIGLLGAASATHFLTKLLFQVKPTDAPAFCMAALVLAVATLLACYVPARRATRVDPMVALRYE